MSTRSINLLIPLLICLALFGCADDDDDWTAPASWPTTVDHLAGSLGGLGSNDGRLGKASFYMPESSVLVGTDLYIADSNSAIRKIDLKAGTVSTFAGTGAVAGSDDGTGTTATFSYISALTSDGTSLFACDLRNNNIRRIDIATGEVTTLAGTAGTSGSTDGTGAEARFDRPQGLAVIGGFLYVSEKSTNLIRKIDISSAEVTTLSLTGDALDSPAGLTTDDTSLFVADYGASGHVRKIDLDTGVVSNLCDITKPSHIDYADGRLYVGCFENALIHTVPVEGGAPTILAGADCQRGYADGVGAKARFDEPRDLCSDGTTIYVCDYDNHAIRAIDIASGEVTTLTGMPAESGSTDATGTDARFNCPSFVVSDGTYLYVTDRKNHTLRKIKIADAKVTTLAGKAGLSGSADGTGPEARFDAPRGITLAGDSLYVADNFNYLIRKVVIATGEVTTLAGEAGVKGTDDGTGTDARFRGPMGLTSDGTFLFLTDGFDSIRRIEIATGVVTTLTDDQDPASIFASPIGIEYVDGMLYVVAHSDSTIRRMDPATGEISILAGTADAMGSADGTGADARFCTPLDVATDGTNLYVTDYGNSILRKITIDGGEVTTLAGKAGVMGHADGPLTAARFFGPEGLSVDKTNRQIFVCSFNHCIRNIR